MLQSLHIQNYALIESIDIDFFTGFSVITGETGAGKSILLGAIGLLLGQRADIKTIRNGASKCIVEAHFNISSYHLEPFFEMHDLEYDAKECILRRELYASGKSRAFINDTPVSLIQMKELSEKLIDIHSQHQNLLLNQENFQMNILDILTDNNKELKSYQSRYQIYKELCQELNTLKKQAEKSLQDEEYFRFQLKELENAHLTNGEEELLEQEAQTLSHAEDIKLTSYKILQLMEEDENGILTSVKEIIQSLQSLSRMYPPSREWNERLNSCYIELKDLSHEISCTQEEIEFNPNRLDYINNRLNLIYSLQKKHHVSTSNELIELANEYRSKLNDISTFDERIIEIESQITTLHQELLDLAKQLTYRREKTAKYMEIQMVKQLHSLGMPNVSFVVELTPLKEIGPQGIDNVTYLFSANKNSTLQNVASIASGGEIARVMLSIKSLIAGTVNLPTIIFDEIDTGVSGSIAEKMALIMQEMGRNGRQVISITHLPQIAARGANHYKVYKKDTEKGTLSYIQPLNEQERINEIAHMLSGTTLTEAALNNAKALLKMNQYVRKE